jgi:hypothetical protein
MTEPLLKPLTNLSPTNPPTVNCRCPHCGHAGSFSGIGANDISWTAQLAVRSMTVSGGVRQCPNPECRSLVFVVARPDGKLEVSYPPQVIDFDSTNLPAPILATLEEAIKSHAAGCFKASALMVRRVLEELCSDKGVTGNDLNGSYPLKITMTARTFSGRDHREMVELDDLERHGEAWSTASMSFAELKMLLSNLSQSECKH